MKQVLTRTAEAKVRNDILGTLNNLVVRLFVNDVFPGPDATEEDFTVPTDDGYEQVAADDWASAGHDAAAREVLTATLATWVFTLSGGSFTIYGFWYWNLDQDYVWSYTRLEVPIQINSVGQTYSVLPTQRIGGIGA